MFGARLATPSVPTAPARELGGIGASGMEVLVSVGAVVVGGVSCPGGVVEGAGAGVVGAKIPSDGGQGVGGQKGCDPINRCAEAGVTAPTRTITTAPVSCAHTRVGLPVRCFIVSS